MKPGIRRERIVDLVREHERMSVDDLAGLLGSSRETIRRDLTELDGRGHIRKVHGGAVMPEAPREGAFPARLSEAIREKRAVARAAAALFGEGDTLFIDTGTTTLLFAEELARRPGITVITNGPQIARTVAAGGGKVFVIGGEYRADVGEMTGSLAVEQIARFHAAHAVITVGGIGRDGAMDFLLDEAQVARAMVAQARSVTVIADGSKLGRMALFQVCPLGRIDRLVVDVRPEGSLAEALTSAGVEVVVADPSA
ncbi:DeoR/GlpR family DNA-binding transcription regulator [Labrys monachus]|uniref:DeoR family glycerol-3-phosphate regulon repressor n=1 Tax=Labrys monachus TaxID=217067 RepID=A0ABU0FBF6_9HYPH|nr:DeoR/GlpR family DNA-binding transcription regulator [Labrys monachus]MDQ0391939.1 DeoR family glycerol-3-phosphate regulon repressor [Labrys monachus]